MVSKVKSAYHLLGLAPTPPDNPKNTKTKPVTNQIFMAKKGRQRTQRLPTPPLCTQTAENPGGYHTFFVSWGFRRGTVSSTGHRNVSRWVGNVSRKKPDPAPAPFQTCGDIGDKLLTSAGHKLSSGNPALPFLSSPLNATLKNLSPKSHCLLISLEGHSLKQRKLFSVSFTVLVISPIPFNKHVPLLACLQNPHVELMKATFAACL